MALPAIDSNAPNFVLRYVNLADARLGAKALACSDDFFAEMNRMLNPEPAVFIAGKYDTNGKWMDGWESRRKRGPGHDWCIVKLARSGQIRGFDLDTSHFTGNFPPAASIEGAYLASGDPDHNTNWQTILGSSNLTGNSHHYFVIDNEQIFSHLRVNLFPDGGLARLRVYGTPSFAQVTRDADGLIDLISALNGGMIVAANNQHFGFASNLLLPGRGITMGDGWETRRRREPGHDWCIIALAHAARIEDIEVDTCHFKGNYPDRCSIQATSNATGTDASLITQSMFWPMLLPEQKLQMDYQHFYRNEIISIPNVTHIRLNIFPDGGVSRLRLRGQLV